MSSAPADRAGGGAGRPPTARGAHRAGRRLLAVVVGAVLVAAGCGLARLRLSTTITSVLPANSRALAAWQAEQRHFGGTPVVMEITSAAPDQLLSGTALLHVTRLEGELARLPGVHVVYGPGTVVNQLSLAAANLLASLTGYRAGLISAAEAQAQAHGADVAAAGQAAAQQFDLQYGPAVVRALPMGLPSLTNPGFATHVFFGSSGAAGQALHWLVPSSRQVDLVIRPVAAPSASTVSTIVDQARRFAARAGLPAGSRAVVVGSPVLAESLSSTIDSELPLLCGVAAVVVLGSFLVTDRRQRWWRRLVPLAVTVAALAVTLGVLGWAHQELSVGLLAFLPIMIGVGTDYPIYAATSMDHRRLAALAAAAAVATASLVVSPLPFVRQLGEALALGLVVSAGLGMVAARCLRGATGGAAAGAAGAAGGGAHADAAAGTAGAAGGVGAAAGNGLPSSGTACGQARQHATPGGADRQRPAGARRRWATVGALGAVGVLGWAALPALHVEADVTQLAAGVPGLHQAVAAENLLGAGGDLEVVVHAPDVLAPSLVGWYQRAEDAVVAADGDQLRPVVSPASLLSWLGSRSGAAQVAAAVGIMPGYLLHAAVSPGGHQAELVFAGRLDRLSADVHLAQSVRRLLPPLPPGASVTVTGLLPVVAGGYRLLGSSIVPSELLGIACFGLVLAALGWRRRRAVLAGVLAAALAVGWGGLVLFVLHVALSPLVMAVGSITAAVGGEFAVVVAGGGGQGSPRWPVVLRAACTSEAGFLALALSQLAIVRQFGLVLAGSVALSMAAAWLVAQVLGEPPRERQGVPAVGTRRAQPTPMPGSGARVLVP